VRRIHHLQRGRWGAASRTGCRPLYSFSGLCFQRFGCITLKHRLYSGLLARHLQRAGRASSAPPKDREQSFGELASTRNTKRRAPVICRPAGRGSARSAASNLWINTRHSARKERCAPVICSGPAGRGVARSAASARRASRVLCASRSPKMESSSAACCAASCAFSASHDSRAWKVQRAKVSLRRRGKRYVDLGEGRDCMCL